MTHNNRTCHIPRSEGILPPATLLDLVKYHPLGYCSLVVSSSSLVAAIDDHSLSMHAFFASYTRRRPFGMICRQQATTLKGTATLKGTMVHPILKSHHFSPSRPAWAKLK